MRAGGLSTNLFKEECNFQSTFSPAQSATESLKRLHNCAFDEYTTLLFTAEIDEVWVSRGRNNTAVILTFADMTVIFVDEKQ